TSSGASYPDRGSGGAPSGRAGRPRTSGFATPGQPRGIASSGIASREPTYAPRRTAHAGPDWLERPPLSSSHPYHIAKGLAAILVAGRWRRADLVERGGLALRGRWRGRGPLVDRLLAACGDGVRPPSARVARFLLNDPGFLDACERDALLLP